MQDSIRKASTRADRQRLVEEAIARLRPQLEWIADALIPADPGLSMPSAREAGVVDTYLARALVARDDMADAFLAEVGRLPAQAPADPLAALTALGPGFDRICRLVAGAFFLDEAVNRKLRYPGQQAIVREQDYEPMIAAIDAVIARGLRYTPVP